MTPAINGASVDPPTLRFDQAVVASYCSQYGAEGAVRRLAKDDLRVDQISVIGRNLAAHKDARGCCRPAVGSQLGNGNYGPLMGTMGCFVMPLVGTLIVMGPLTDLITGTLSNAREDGLTNGLIAAGVPREQASTYQQRLQEGEFLVFFHGRAIDTTWAREVLERTPRTDLQTYSALREESFPEVNGLFPC